MVSSDSSSPSYLKIQKNTDFVDQLFLFFANQLFGHFPKLRLVNHLCQFSKVFYRSFPLIFDIRIFAIAEPVPPEVASDSFARGVFWKLMHHTYVTFPIREIFLLDLVTYDR
jgi:hypothetical protein